MTKSDAPMLLFLIFLLNFSASPAGAPPEDQPRFTASHVSVPVDVVVTDRRGRIVSNLTRENFEIVEGGVRQEIETFQFVSFDAPTSVGEDAADALARSSVWQEDTVSAQGSDCLKLNFMVFLIDFAGTPFQNQQRVIQATQQHVETLLRKCDRVAVFATGPGFRLIHNFTDDVDSLAESISQLVGSRWGEAEAAVTAHFSQGDLQARIADLEALHAADLQAGMGSELLAALAAARSIESYQRMLSYVHEREGRTLLVAIEALAEGLAQVPGRKNVVLFSSGFVVGAALEAALERVVSRANSSGVSVYAVDSLGLAPGELQSALRPRDELSDISATYDSDSPLARTMGGSRIAARGGESLFDRAKSVGSDVRESALRYLAAATGGTSAHRTNDFLKALSEIDANLRSYYLLTYQPARQQMDGTYRTIEVRIAGARDDYILHHRTGYVALPPGMEILTGEEYRVLDSLERGAADSRIEAAMQGGWFHLNRNRGALVLSLQLNPDELKCAKREAEGKDAEAAANCLVDLVGLVRDEQGFPLQRFGSLEFPAIDAPRPDASERKGGFRTHLALELAPGIYTVQLVLRDRIGGAVGLVERPFRLLELREPLAISSVVISDTVTPAEGGQGLLLTVDDVSVHPTPEPTFRSGDKMVYFFQVYATAEEAVEAEFEVIAEARQAGGDRPIGLTRFVMKAGLQPGLTTVPFARFAELEGLAAGTYLVDVRVRDLESGDIATARSFFRIED